MDEQYAELLSKESLFYNKIQQTLNELSSSSYENLHSNLQITESYRCVLALQCAQSHLIRILMGTENFRAENALLICFIENNVCVNTLNESQKYDIYNLLYKLSTVEPGKNLLRYFIENSPFKIFLRPGNSPSAQVAENRILFPLQPNFAPLHIMGGISARLIPEIRHISLGHELIHFYHSIANIVPSTAFARWKNTWPSSAETLLYSEPFSTLKAIKTDERLTIEGDIDSSTPLITENSLRLAFKLETRLGWRIAALEHKEEIKNLLLLVDTVHNKSVLPVDDIIRLTSPFPAKTVRSRSTIAEPSLSSPNPIAAPSGQNQIALSIGSLMDSFFSNYHLQRGKKPWPATRIIPRTCTIL